jgi:hypothetical protein
LSGKESAAGPDWYAELTGEIPSPTKVAGPDFRFFGEWTEQRVDGLLGACTTDRRCWLTDYQERRLKDLPGGEPLGVVYDLSGEGIGVAVTCRVQSDQTELPVSLGLAASRGMQHPLRIDRAHVSHDRLNAVIEGAILAPGADKNDARDEIPIAFVDYKFAVARGFYRKGLVNDFILAGFARVVGPARNRKFERPIEPWMKSVGLEPEPGRDTVDWDLSELTAWLERDELGLTAYEFRGRIETIKPVPGETDWTSRDLRRGELVFGVKAWRLRVLVAQYPDLLMDIFISDAVWREPAPPAVGEWIEGIVTMSGYCWW